MGNPCPLGLFSRSLSLFVYLPLRLPSGGKVTDTYISRETRVGISDSIPTCKRKHEPCGTPAASQLVPKVKCCKTKPSHATCVPIPTLRSDSHTIRRKKSEHQTRKFGAISAGTGSRTMVQQSRPTVLHRKLRLSLPSTHHANLHLIRSDEETNSTPPRQNTPRT